MHKKNALNKKKRNHNINLHLQHYLWGQEQFNKDPIWPRVLSLTSFLNQLLIVIFCTGYMMFCCFICMFCCESFLKYVVLILVTIMFSDF